MQQVLEKRKRILGDEQHPDKSKAMNSLANANTLFTITPLRESVSSLLDADKTLNEPHPA